MSHLSVVVMLSLSLLAVNSSRAEEILVFDLDSEDEEVINSQLLQAPTVHTLRNRAITRVPQSTPHPDQALKENVYSVVLGSFQNQRNAQLQQEQFKKKGIRVEVSKENHAQFNSIYVIHLPHIYGYTAAQSRAKKVQAQTQAKDIYILKVKH